MGIFGDPHQRKVATYAGIGIYATKIASLTDEGPSKIALSVEGNTVTTEPFTPISTESGRLGVIRRISNLVAGLDTRLTEIQERIGNYETNIVDAAVELDQPFTHATELVKAARPPSRPAPGAEQRSHR